MWQSMLAVMEKHGVLNVNFCGFMAESAQTNFNAVREIFGSGNKSQSMENKERICLFYWTMTLDRHIKRYIRPKLQDMHNRLCHEYQKCRTKTDADTTIKAWWYSSGGVSKNELKELVDWINFWHFRFHQWGSFIFEVLMVF